MRFSVSWGYFEAASGVVGAFWVPFRRLRELGVASGAGPGIGFWVEKIETFEKFRNGLKSIGDGFRNCLAAFWFIFRCLGAVLRLLVALLVRFGCHFGASGSWGWHLEVVGAPDFGSKK